MRETNRKAVVAAVMVMNFLAAIDVSIVGTAMPTIVGKLGGLSLMSWVFSAYVLTSAVSTPIYGKLADLYGRKITFTVGASIFLIGSILCGMSDSMLSLVWARAVQGLGAGSVLSIAATIIGDIFTVEERGRAQGWFSSVWGISSIFGPFIGGLIVDYMDWPWVFYVNPPFVILALVLLWFGLHEKIEKRPHTIDYGGALMLTASVTALLLGLLEGPIWSWSNPLTIALLVGSVIGLFIFIQIERRSKEPVLPLELFQNRVISVSFTVSFLLGAILLGVTSYIPIFMQGVLQSTATIAGLALAPMSVGWMIAAIYGGKRVMKWGFFRLSMTGAIFAAIGTLMLIGLSQSTGSYYAILSMTVIGMGLGLATLAFTVVVQNAVDWNRRGIATASLQFIRSLGSAIGVAAMGAMLTARMTSLLSSGAAASIQDPLQAVNSLLSGHSQDPHLIQLRPMLINALESGLHSVYWVLAVIGILCVVFMLAFPREKRVAQKSVS